MSGKAVARGAIVSIAAALMFAVPTQANDAAHKIAEKFAGEADGAGTTEGAKKKDAERKAAEAKKPATERKATPDAKKPDAEPAEAAAQREAERKAEAARKLEAQRKAEAARKAAEAKRRAAAKAAEEARRAVELRRADESEMLARARREADEMRVAEEEERLTEEARRLIEQAEMERAKAEELLASEGAPTRPAAEPSQTVAAEPERAKPTDDEQLARQRAEDARRLAEKLSRVRQLRESRAAGKAGRDTEEKAVAGPAPAAPPPEAAPPSPPAESVASAPPATPPGAPVVTPAPAPVEAAAPAVAVAPPPAEAPPATATVTPAPTPPQADPPSHKPEAVAAAPLPANPAPPAIEVPASAPTAPAAEPRLPEPPPHVAAAPVAVPTPPAPSAPTIKSAIGRDATRVTVLLVMTPGTYGIRRNGPKVADPILCTRDGCYVSAGAERSAVFLPGRKALGFGNTWGARAGACRNTLGCVFRGIELGTLPGFLQPVDLHILKHDRRAGHAVLADSDCRTEAGRLYCRHGIDADDYTMWIIPEGLAETAGPTALQRALTDGLNAPRSAQLAPAR